MKTRPETSVFVEVLWFFPRNAQFNIVAHACMSDHVYKVCLSVNIWYSIWKQSLAQSLQSQWNHSINALPDITLYSTVGEWDGPCNRQWSTWNMLTYCKKSHSILPKIWASTWKNSNLVLVQEFRCPLPPSHMEIQPRAKSTQEQISL